VRLPSHRDRALVAFYVSTGARASELLSVTQGGVDPARQLITVIRKGTGDSQQLPASTDAFVWLRLYELQMDGLIPVGRRQPLWWTLRRPPRPLTYHATHRMFERVNARAGTRATLHALRHTAAYRMAEDAALPLTDVQLVLGHAQFSTTQIYLTPRKEDVIRRLLAHHATRPDQASDAASGDGAGTWVPTGDPRGVVRRWPVRSLLADEPTAETSLTCPPETPAPAFGAAGRRPHGRRHSAPADRRRSYWHPRRSPRPGPSAAANARSG
jgi:Phage integrase family